MYVLFGVKYVFFNVIRSQQLMDNGNKNPILLNTPLGLKHMEK